MKARHIKKICLILLVEVVLVLISAAKQVPLSGLIALSLIAIFYVFSENESSLFVSSVMDEVLSGLPVAFLIFAVWGVLFLIGMKVEVVEKIMLWPYI